MPERMPVITKQDRIKGKHISTLIGEDLRQALTIAEYEIQQRRYDIWREQQAGIYTYSPATWTPELTLSNGAQVNRWGHVVLNGTYLGALSSITHKPTLQAYQEWLNA
jgi:hypothetical protein